MARCCIAAGALLVFLYFPQYLSAEEESVSVQEVIVEAASQGVEWGVWEVTAYACPPHCGVTASGQQVGPGSIAAPWWVPFGTVLCVEGWGCGVVNDRGGAIYGNRLDVFMNSRAEAFQWGRRWVTVTQLERVLE